MQGEALSPRGRRGAGYWPILLPVILLGLYYATTSGVRVYVSHQIQSVEGQEVPAFSLRDRSGRRWTQEDLRGKVTLLNFFRSKCVSCMKERDAIQAMAADSPSTGLQVLSVMLDEVQGYQADVTAQTLRKLAYEHPVLMADEPFIEAFHGAGWAHVTPVTYVLDAKGVVTRSLRGHQSLETLRAATQ